MFGLGDDARVMDIGVSYLRIVGSCYIFFAIMFISNGVINGAGHTMMTMAFSLLSLWLVRVPAAWLLSAHRPGDHGHMGGHSAQLRDIDGSQSRVLLFGKVEEIDHHQDAGAGPVYGVRAGGERPDGGVAGIAICGALFALRPPTYVQYAYGQQGSDRIDISSIPPCRHPPDPGPVSTEVAAIPRK